ncbi:hypothetical protein B0T14DRAFT_568039 [Immersiella caudata]|uniref:Rhodopsin domain-containing protein n=1 Tax=Immersiella caudata TaxID=314043 RepID=A0AA39WJ90_9PEZI|nr:hypothetical protein B0T14DRAFT_568039 [Immersiella caudata]
MSNSTDLAPSPLPDPAEWNGYSTAPCVAIALSLAIIAVSLRFWARAGIVRVTGLEDWFILASLGFSAAITACVGLQLRHGLGKHAVYVSPDDVQEFFKLSIIITILYVLSMTFTKLSILCLYIRVLSYDAVRLAAKILLGIVLVSHAYIVATLCTACVPFDAFWDFAKRPTAFCQPQPVYWSHAGLNIVTDFLIFILPLTVLHKIRCPRPQKVALAVIFLLAFSVCIISVVRVIMIARDIEKGDMDFTWNSATTANWNTFEVNIAILCACLTTVKPAVTRMFPSLSASGPTSAPLSKEIDAARGARRRVGRWERDLLDTDGSVDVVEHQRRGMGEVKGAGSRDIETGTGSDGSEKDLVQGGEKVG